ncbi:MAG TPA: acetate/propionate family kinase [Candidatus Binataceae bacterium]|nr:acetate/propionate family kinase [Candidatus Binataceae bacterium]
MTSETSSGSVSPAGAVVILSLNSGSSSRKFSLYRLAGSTAHLLADGAAEQVGDRRGRLWIRDGDANPLADAHRDWSDRHAVVPALLDEVLRLVPKPPDAVGHRIVHGGAAHRAPELVTPGLLAALRGIIAFAPLHLPAELDAIDAVAVRLPATTQVVCFDTAFHARMPQAAARLALPRALWDAGIRRYGFHGISYEYIMRQLGADAPGRVIIAHLGGGASMAAVRDGAPIDTTMGFTPAGGFMMGTRGGDLDPGVIVYLIKEMGYDADRLGELVNFQAGLLGVSGLSADVKKLLDREADLPDAALALEMFCYQARKQIGAYAAALEGLDLLVFTGGIGEHAAPIRARICAGLEHLGVEIDAARNSANQDTISKRRGRCAVRVIPTNEDLMIALHTERIIRGLTATPPAGSVAKLVEK